LLVSESFRRWQSIIGRTAIVLLLLLLALSFLARFMQGAEPAVALERLSSPAGEGESFAPRMVSDGDEGLILSWLQVVEPGRHALKFAHFDGQGWSSPKTVSEGEDWFANWADTPGVRPVGDDWLFAHWLVRSGPGAFHYDIHAAWSDDGGESWGESFLLHRDGEQAEHGFLSSVVFPDGDLGVAWLDGRHTIEQELIEGEHEGHSYQVGGGSMSIRWARFGPGESRADMDVEVDDKVCDCCMTASVLEPEGPRIVYRDRKDDEIRDISSARPMVGSEPPQRDGRVSEDGWYITGCPVNGPAVARHGAHTAVAWFTAANNEPRVQLSTLQSDGTAVNDPLRLDAGRPLGRVALEALDEERLIAAWIEQEGNQAAIMVRTIQGERLSEPFALVDIPASRSSGFPVLARAGNQILMAWTEMEPEGRQVKVGVMQP